MWTYVAANPPLRTFSISMVIDVILRKVMKSKQIEATGEVYISKGDFGLVRVSRYLIVRSFVSLWWLRSLEKIFHTSKDILILEKNTLA